MFKVFRILCLSPFRAFMASVLMVTHLCRWQTHVSDMCVGSEALAALALKASVHAD